MPFEKGHKKVGGKSIGTPNKTTKAVKEMIQAIADDQMPKWLGWIDNIAKKDPEKAIKIVTELLEYISPKLQRTELTGADGKDFMPARTLTKEEAKDLLKSLNSDS